MHHSSPLPPHSPRNHKVYGLERAWRLHDVTCAECGTSMRLTEAHVTALREGVIEARVRLDALTRKAENEESP